MSSSSGFAPREPPSVAATIQLIRIAAQNEKVQTAADLREFVVSSLVDKASPTSAALDLIKQEVGQLW